ncbi:MAG: alpha/beta hydrolase [Cyanobacteria bacterium J06639_16]
MSEIFSLPIGSAQLAGERAGDGEPLVFLHAGVADRRMWLSQMAELSDGHYTVAYDRRGFGETTTTDEAFSHVEDLRELLDQLDISTGTLIGCSQGGRVAIDFVLAYPQRVNALVLISPAISGAPVPEAFPSEIQALMAALDEADEADDLDQINAIEANLWLDGPTSPAGRVGGGLRELFLDMNGIALGMPELTQEIEPASAYEKLSNLSLSTLVIWGELDFPHIKECCRYIVESIPAAQGIEIAATAHLPNLEKPETINELLQDFLK